MYAATVLFRQVDVCTAAICECVKEEPRSSRSQSKGITVRKVSNILHRTMI